MDAIEIATKAISVYSIVLIVFGSLFNLLSFIVICVRKKLRQIPTFVFVAFSLVTDTITLYFWNLDQYLLPFHGYMIEYVSIHACRFSTFMQLSSLQSSAWLLVLMSFERLLSVQLKNWRSVYFSSKKAAVASSVLIGIICLTNFHVFFTIDYTELEQQNYTAADICLYTYGFSNWKQVHLYIYSIVPFAVLGVVNSMLIYRTINPSKSITRSNEEKARRKNMSISVILMTLSFILLTIPNAIAGGYYIGILFQSRIGILILFLCTCLLFSYHAFNFAVLMIANKKFKTEFHDFLTNIRGKETVRTTVNTLTTGNTACKSVIKTAKVTPL